MSGTKSGNTRIRRFTEIGVQTCSCIYITTILGTRVSIEARERQFDTLLDRIADFIVAVVRCWTTCYIIGSRASSKGTITIVSNGTDVVVVTISWGGENARSISRVASSREVSVTKVGWCASFWSIDTSSIDTLVSGARIVVVTYERSVDASVRACCFITRISGTSVSIITSDWSVRTLSSKNIARISGTVQSITARFCGVCAVSSIWVAGIGGTCIIIVTNDSLAEIWCISSTETKVGEGDVWAASSIESTSCNSNTRWDEIDSVIRVYKSIINIY